MLHRKSNKYFRTKKESIARHATISKYHNRRDDHGNDRNSRRMRKLHHSLRKSTRRFHASLGPGRNPSVSPMRRQRTSHEGDILQGELRKIKPHTFNGEKGKEEEVEA
jgi:hypothetical protein